jgi:23S rRNA (adenine1618-N6)-methyltransferase
LHPNNPHLNGYDMSALVLACADLKPFITQSKHGRDTINFSNPAAVKQLNRALLINHYGLTQWDIPKGYLCPPIPGRVDYLLGLNDALVSHLASMGKVLTSNKVNALDIGTGANLIYPIAGQALFGWNWLGTDIDQGSVNNAQSIIDANPALINSIKLKLQPNSRHIFNGIIASNDYYDVTCCNPPFHKSAADAHAGSLRKNNNLIRNKKKRQSNLKSNHSEKTLNFEGQSNELWCEGGELAFISNIINESKQVADQVGLFSCLISKKENIKALIDKIKWAKATSCNVHEMQQGNKISRFITWSFV